MAHNRPIDPASRRRESLLFDPVLWLFAAIILFFAWANTPPATLGPQQGEQAKTQVTRTQIEQFKSATQLFQIDNGRAPKSLDELIHQPSHARNWKKYLLDLNEIPKDPWGEDYVYRAPGPRGEPFRIVSCGPDGKEGTKDDITSGSDRDPKTGW